MNQRDQMIRRSEPLTASLQPESNARPQQALRQTNSPTLLHADATPRSLAVWRVCLLLICLIWTLENDWSLTAWIPREQFRPAGVFKIPFLFDFLLKAHVLRWLQWAALAFCTLGILNIWTRWSVLLATLLNLVYYRISVSLPFNRHEGLSVIFGGFILAGSLFLEHRDRRRGIDRANYAPAVLQLTALALLGTYSLVGAHRLAFAAPETLRAEFLLGWLVERGGSGDFQYSLQIQDHPWLLRALELGFPAVTLLELLAPLSLVSRPIKWAFLLTTIPLHFMTLFLMNIFFWQNLLLVLLLLTNFSALCHPGWFQRWRLQKTKITSEPS